MLLSLYVHRFLVQYYNYCSNAPVKGGKVKDIDCKMDINMEKGCAFTIVI